MVRQGPPLPLKRGPNKAPRVDFSGPSTPTSLRATETRSGSPRSRTSPASNASREANAATEQTEHLAMRTDAPGDATTPKVLWASTPTPKGGSTYSFALPPERPQAKAATLAGKLNAEAAAFIPDLKSLQSKDKEQQIPQALRAFRPSHAEAQAVMMAESLLGLDPEPKQGKVAQVAQVPSSQSIAQDPVEADQSHQEPVKPVPAKLPSKGSAFHEQGQCRPCAWMWKPRGCQNADICEYCHLCPEGELKHRKKLKIAAIRMGALAALPNDQGTQGRRGLKLSTLL
eukprot:Skav215963  [mRNA]  locus=scaffold226:1132471:1133328:+ [translate_table: standard]